MSVQNSAQSGQELRRGFIGYAASVIRPGPALGYDLVRAYLGIGLFVRGILFVSQPDLVLGYLQDVHSWFLPYALVHFVAVAHLCGGVMLGIGLATRLAAALQVPILFGAVFLVHSQSGLLNVGQSLEFSGLVLALLLVYLTFGSGRLSVDAFLARAEVRALEVQTPSLIPERPLRQAAMARATLPQKLS
ncbi:MAG TPA: DoxX family protein [Polyangiaceae bacterium]|nr:DoxX family protein [Polyangiaceae bacterium]